jgi:hypothetical protein
MALPLEEEEQALLLDSLGELVAARGPAALLAGPIAPTPAFFPDRFTPTASGARVVAERLLGYAGLGSHRGVVEVGRPDRFDPDAEGPGPEGAAAWFAGVEGFNCFFGVNERHLGDADALVASLAHEVAHAYRRVHGLEETGTLTEERATDVTTVFLGFGVLTANASERLFTTGVFHGTTSITRSWQQRLGYLPPQALTFLLAAQAVARRAGWRERGRLSGVLGPNQAALFRAARAALARREGEVVRRLRLSAARLGTPAPRPMRIVEPVVHGPTAPAPRASPPARDVDVAGGPVRPTFRVTGRRKPMAGLTGAMVAAAPFAIWALVTHGPWPLVLGAAPATWLAARWGRRRPDHCADPDCGAVLPDRSAWCPGCQRPIAGSIARAEDRLEAEDRLGSAPLGRRSLDAFELDEP